LSSLERLALAVQLPAFSGPVLPAGVAQLLDQGLGGVCLFGGNLPFAPLVRSVRETSPDAVVATDEEGGDISRLYHDTSSPTLGHATLGAIDDLALTRATAAGIGTMLQDVGVDLNLGPVADVNSNPRNPVIGTRSFGTDPDLVSRHVVEYIAGLQSAGVAACVKHFPGHGDTHEDSHVSLPRVDGPLDAPLMPFRAAVAAGVVAVMTSHIVVAAVDQARPATLSPAVLLLLRSDLGFQGIIVSDALDMAGVSANRGIPATAVQALAAGCDLLCHGPDKDVALVRAVQMAVVAAVRSGVLAEQRLVDAVARIAARPRFTAVLAPLDEGRQLAGARAAIRVDGELPDLTDAVLVRVESGPSSAVGAVPWGMPGKSIDPATYDGEPGRPVVLQAQDAHRHPDVLALVERLADRLEGIVVVEFGWAGPWPLAVPRVSAQGTSLPAREAIRELLETCTRSTLLGG
jgi:beta-N-acetylhexosaminidase